MSNIEFQNGFLCGMATKGMTKGTEYKPLVWNDEGEYGYFYIDFKQALSEFSLGMFNESIIIYDSEQLWPTKIEFISSGIYKVTCDIADKFYGVTVINKKSSILETINNGLLKVFSVIFYVNGTETYIRKAYKYEKPLMSNRSTSFSVIELESREFWQNIAPTNPIDIVSYPESNEFLTENVNISYWVV